MANNLQEAGRLLFIDWNINIYEVPLEQMDHYIAVKNFLTDDEYLPDNAENLAKVRHYIESLHQLCSVRKWKLVSSLIDISITTITKTAEFSLPLSEFFLFKSLFNNSLEISNEIINSFQNDPKCLIDINILKARSLSGMGNLIESILIYQDLLKQDISKLSFLEIDTYLIICQVQSEKFTQSIPVIQSIIKSIDEFLTHPLQLGVRSKLLNLQGKLFGDLAYCQMNLSNFQEAIELYSKSFELFESNNSIHLTINPLVHKGIILRKMFRSKESIDSLRLAISKAEEIDDSESLTWIYHHLSWAFRLEKKYKEAEINAVNSLKGYEKINDERGINDCHELLGWICLDIGKIDEAVQKFEIAVEWRKNNHRPQGTASCMIGLAVAYLRRGKILRSFITAWQGLNLYRQAGILNFKRLSRILKFANIFRNLLLGKNR